MTDIPPFHQHHNRILAFQSHHATLTGSLKFELLFQPVYHPWLDKIERP